MTLILRYMSATVSDRKKIRVLFAFWLLVVAGEVEGLRRRWRKGGLDMRLTIKRASKAQGRSRGLRAPEQQQRNKEEGQKNTHI